MNDLEWNKKIMLLLLHTNKSIRAQILKNN